VTATGPGSGDPPLPARYVVKSVWEEASVGLEDDCVVAATDLAGLQREIRERAGRLGGEAFAELYIAGREFNLAVLGGPDGPELLPPAEIRFVDYPDDRPKLVGYRAKWDDQSFEYHHTPHCFDFPRTDDALLAELGRLARDCWQCLGLRGYARVDFRVDEAGRPWVLEINANPCLSPDAGFSAAADRAGLSFEQVVQRILADVH
jgi:D-alanine-D-alanine ligase